LTTTTHRHAVIGTPAAHGACLGEPVIGGDQRRSAATLASLHSIM